MHPIRINHVASNRVIITLSMPPNAMTRDCEQSYIGETKHPLHKRMYQHRCSSSSGINDSAVYSHLTFLKHLFNDKDVLVLDKEHKWFVRGVKEAIYVCCKEPSLNRVGELGHNLPRAYDRAIRRVQRQLSCDIITNPSVNNWSSDHSA